MALVRVMALVSVTALASVTALVSVMALVSQRVPQAIAVRKPRDHRSESDSSVTELTDLTALG
jgi:hypothetical protein